MSNSSVIRELLKPKNEWAKDNQVTHCYACQKEFLKLIRHRHHCRFCGNVFCSKCSQNIIYGNDIDYKVEKKLRHCQKCRERINAVIKEDVPEFEHKSQMYDINEKYFKFELEDAQMTSNVSFIGAEEEEVGKKYKQLADSFNQSCKEEWGKIIAKLCQANQLIEATWSKRLYDLAITATELHVDSFIRPDYFNLSKEVKIVTILTTQDYVTAVCVKGWILERNIPSKQLESHQTCPNILIFKPAIEAESLMQGNETRFDQIIKNESSIMKNYLQKIFKLQPKVIFVAEHVSKVAFEEFLKNNITVISKVKPDDLRMIERLALIKKTIDHLQFIDKYRPNDVIGGCQKIYFKNVNKGEMLMFIEREQAGIRSILLGDYSEDINIRLKMVFSQLLKLMWAIKKNKEIILKDLKFIVRQNYLSYLVLFEKINWEKYATGKMGSILKASGTKIVYSCKRLQEIPKAFENYCSKLGHQSFLQLCGFPKTFQIHYYQGQDLLLGTYLLKCIANNSKTCKSCSGQHIERYFIGSYHVTIKFEPYNDRVSTKINLKQLYESQDEEEDGGEKKEGKQVKKKIEKEESVLVYESITRYIRKFQVKEKMFFILYFKCDHCGEVINNYKIRLGREYLSINFLHYVSQLVQIYCKKGLSCHNNQVSNDEGSCNHENIVRVIQCPRMLIKFYVSPSIFNEINPIQPSEKIKKNMQAKDEKYLIQIYNHQLAQKYRIIQEMQIQMSKMPFSVSLSSTFISTISGISPHEHFYYPFFQKIKKILNQMMQKLTEIQRQYMSYFSKPDHDWTIALRKFSKIEHVLKLQMDIIFFMNNALKKQKIEDTNSLEDNLNFIEQFDIKKLRKDSQALSIKDSPSQIKFHTSNSMTSLIKTLRKDTGGTELEQIDDIFKRSRRYRYPLYQGTKLYYPIASINDPTSLLACCLNSVEFSDHLGEEQYKDFITCKMKFTKHLQTEWKPNQQTYKIYSEILKEEPKNQTYQFIFSIYYHREFEELRISEGVDFNLYIRSLYGCQNWDSSGGKSNSTFSKSHNDVLVVKIINDKEFVQFQKFALAYLDYMKEKRDRKDQSYLAKIYGIYEANIRNKIYKFVVMQNIFIGVTGPMKVYDLKGSQVNRLVTPVGDKSYTGLDTNFLIDKYGKPYILEENIYEKTIRTFEEDANFLKDQCVIDYSLLVIQSEKMLRMGIIDFMRPYHIFEKIQTIYKGVKSGKDPTVIPPKDYSERFINSMKKYFIKVKND